MHEYNFFILTAKSSWTITFLDNVGNLPLLEPTSQQLRSISGGSRDAVLTNVVVSTAVKQEGTEPLFDEGTVGIYTMPLVSFLSAQREEI